MLHTTKPKQLKVKQQTSRIVSIPPLKKEQKRKDAIWQFEHLSPLVPLYQFFDSRFANRLAFTAIKQAKKANKKGYCLRSVRHSLNRTNTFFYSFNHLFFNLNNLPTDLKQETNSFPGRSAEDFRLWAIKNPLTLCKELHLANITHLPNRPIRKGLLYFYRKGSYGFNKKYGHVEIVVKSSPLVACSTVCRKVPVYNKPHTILAPVKNCSSLMLYQSKEKLSQINESKQLIASS